MLFHSIRRLFASSRRNTRVRPARRLWLEHLEDRYTPSVAGFLDRSFATGGKATYAFDVGGDKYDGANAVAVQADGKVVVVGTVQVSNQGSDIGVVRYKRDGSVDRTFGQNGRV